MSIATSTVSFVGGTGYLAWPERATTPLPAIVVIQEVWGLDSHIRDVTQRIAAAGYAALAPDLYAIDGRRPAELTVERVVEVQSFLNAAPPSVRHDAAARSAELQKLPAESRVQIDESYRALFANIGRLPEFIRPLLNATRFLRYECEVSRQQKVACVGFCMGGGLSALLAAHDPELAGAAIFYGTAPSSELLRNVRAPVIGFYGELDERVNAGLPAFAAAMQAENKPFEYQVYPGAQHAFFNDTRASYNVRAARDSYWRLLEFFRRTVGS
jgi:carboxymethylenebutenolidase